VARDEGQSALVENEYDEQMLDQSESLDSDEVRNDDGDEVVDPPDKWIEADEHESLDERLAEETPDDGPDEGPSRQAHDADEGGALVVVSDEDLDRIDPTKHGPGERPDRRDTRRWRLVLQRRELTRRCYELCCAA
jgi:hypothetical protein